jgi:hypothetical protein
MLCLLSDAMSGFTCGAAMLIDALLVVVIAVAAAVWGTGEDGRGGGVTAEKREDT